MKRPTAVLSLAIVAAATALAGCGGGTTAGTQATPPPTHPVAPAFRPPSTTFTLTGLERSLITPAELGAGFTLDRSAIIRAPRPSTQDLTVCFDPRSTSVRGALPSVSVHSAAFISQQINPPATDPAATLVSQTGVILATPAAARHVMAQAKTQTARCVLNGTYAPGGHPAHWTGTVAAFTAGGWSGWRIVLVSHRPGKTAVNNDVTLLVGEGDAVVEVEIAKNGPAGQASIAALAAQAAQVLRRLG